MSNEEVKLTVEQYADIKSDIAVIKRVLPDLAKDLREHMDEEEGERRKIYRVLLVLGGLLLLQSLGIQLDPGTLIGLFT